MALTFSCFHTRSATCCEEDQLKHNQETITYKWESGLVFPFLWCVAVRHKTLYFSNAYHSLLGCLSDQLYISSQRVWVCVLGYMQSSPTNSPPWSISFPCALPGEVKLERRVSVNITGLFSAAAQKHPLHGSRAQNRTSQLTSCVTAWCWGQVNTLSIHKLGSPTYRKLNGCSHVRVTSSQWVSSSCSVWDPGSSVGCLLLRSAYKQESHKRSSHSQLIRHRDFTLVFASLHPVCPLFSRHPLSFLYLYLTKNTMTYVAKQKSKAHKYKHWAVSVAVHMFSPLSFHTWLFFFFNLTGLLSFLFGFSGCITSTWCTQMPPCCSSLQIQAPPMWGRS